jgi:hypothetical protein
MKDEEIKMLELLPVEVGRVHAGYRTVEVPSELFDKMLSEIKARNVAETALRELVEAIGCKWDGESERKRANALSPRIEEALAAAKSALAANKE